MKKILRNRCVHETMTMRDVRDIIVATLRAHKRTNELIMGDIWAYDELFECLNKNNIVPTDEQWKLFESSWDTSKGVVLGSNYVHETTESINATITAGAAKGVHPEIMQLATRYYCKIHLYVDELTDHLYYCGVYDTNCAEYVQKKAMRLLLHERRHSCQDPSEIAKDYSKVAPADRILLRSTINCEVDADRWADWQLDHCYDL